MAVVYPKPMALRPPAVALVDLLKGYFRSKSRK